MKAKLTTYGIIGLVSGILLAYLFGMGGMIDGGWTLMNGEMHDRGENYNRLEYSGNN